MNACDDSKDFYRMLRLIKFKSLMETVAINHSAAMQCNETIRTIREVTCEVT